MHARWRHKEIRIVCEAGRVKVIAQDHRQCTLVIVARKDRCTFSGALQDLNGVRGSFNSVHVEAGIADLLRANGRRRVRGKKLRLTSELQVAELPGRPGFPKTGALASKLGPGSTMCLPVLS